MDQAVLPIQRVDRKCRASVRRTEELRMAGPWLFGRTRRQSQLRVAFEHRCLNTEPKLCDQQARRVAVHPNVELVTERPRELLGKLDDEIIQTRVCFLEGGSLSARIDRILSGFDFPRADGSMLHAGILLGFRTPFDRQARSRRYDQRMRCMIENGLGL